MKVIMWYDRYTKSWVVQVKDENDNQIGTADYVYSRREAVLIKKDLERVLTAIEKRDNIILEKR